MKLTPVQIEQTAVQLEARPVPEESQLAPELQKVFGDHTFFIGPAGLHIIEVLEDGASEARAVKLAGWMDSQRTTLAPHNPEVTETVVALDRAA